LNVGFCDADTIIVVASGQQVPAPVTAMTMKHVT
jgi:hypothetical protein